MNNFGFSVRVEIANDLNYDNPIFIENELLPDGGEYTYSMIKIVKYNVELPHQCDSFIVTRTKNKDEAIHEMEQFISEAQMALEKLKNLGADEL